MKNDKSLPVYGVGPIYGIFVFLITAAGIVLHCTGLLKSGEAENSAIKVIFIVSGALLIAAGVAMWITAVLVNRIDQSIKSNSLKTTGVYNVIAPGTTGELKFKVSGKSEVKCKVTVRIDNTPTELWDVSLLVQKELDQRKIDEYYPLYWNFMFKSPTSGNTTRLEAYGLNALLSRTYDGGSTINDLEYIFEPGEEINEVFALWWSWDFERNAASFRGRNSPLYNLGFTANERDTIFGYAINSGMTPEEWGGHKVFLPQISLRVY